VARYRLPSHSIMELCDIVQQDIHRVTHRSHPLTVATQVLATLHFYATGCMQKDVGDLHVINQPSASRSITSVSAAIACLARGQELYFCPTIKPHQNHAGFWGGVAWQSVAPHHSEHLYICRKGFHAKNVQVGCDSQLRFTNIAAKWPGSTHDSFMGQNSALYHRAPLSTPIHGGVLKA